MVWVIDTCGNRNNGIVELSVVVHAYNPSSCGVGWGHQDDEFKDFLSYTVSSRPAYTTERPSPKKITTTTTTKLERTLLS